MKKIGMLLLCLLPVLAFCGCSNDRSTKYPVVNEYEGVSLAVDQENLSATKGVFLLKNDTDHDITYLDAYHMEKKDSEGNWEEFVGTASATWSEETKTVAAGTEEELAINWKNLCGNIGKGEFRVVIEVDGYPIAAEFTRE